MSITVVGSIAIDSLFSKEGQREWVLGGSAVYSSIAASIFTQPSIVGVVGGDFTSHRITLLEKCNIDVSDIQIIEDGETFKWEGSYVDNINEAKTLQTVIGVLADFHPKLSEKSAQSDILFLANNDPDSQLEAASQSNSRIIAIDTMNLWLNTKNKSLAEAINVANILFINDGEFRLLTEDYNSVQGARKIFKYFPKLEYIVLKKGEYGAAIFGRDDHEYFMTGAYPLDLVKDPTGAGDSFAGSFLGYITKHEYNWKSLKEALLVGTVVSSFTVQEFGPQKIISITEKDMNERLIELKKFMTI